MRQKRDINNLTFLLLNTQGKKQEKACAINDKSTTVSRQYDDCLMTTK